MARIDLRATIEGLTFPVEIWAWLDVLGDAIAATQSEAQTQEVAFVADTPYRKVLLGGIHTHLSGMKAVYALLRMELVGQAAGQARLLCESVINLVFIGADSNDRASAFMDYAAIEAYEAVSALIEWESSSAEPAHAEAVLRMRDKLRPDYEKAQPRYQFRDKAGKTRRYSNWANTPLANMAKITRQTERLYELIYRQLSSYVHGSAWSFRHIPAYTPEHYDVNIVLADVAQVTMGTLAVWQVFAEFVDAQLDWDLGKAVPGILGEAQLLARVSRTGPKSACP